MVVFSSGKKIIFYVIAFLIPFIILALLEVSFRIFGVGDDLRLFNKANRVGHLQVNPLVAKRYSASPVLLPP